MADTKDKVFDVDAALSAGVPEDKIIDFLSSHSKAPAGYDYKADLEKGASHRDVAYKLAGIPLDSKDREGFWSSYHRHANPLPAARLAFKATMLRDPSYAGSPEGQKVPGELYQGFVEPQVKMLRKAGAALKEGKLGTALEYGVAGAVPGIGPAVEEGMDQWQSGDKAAALGTWAALLTPWALGKGAGYTIGKVGEKISPKLYRAGLSFGENVPLRERPQIVDRGLGRDVAKAAGETPEGGTVASLKGLEKIEERLRETKPRQLAEVQKATASGITTISRNWILQPLYDLADRYENAGGSKQAKVLKDLADEFKLKHKQNDLSPDEVQQLKEDTDTLLSGKDFGDKELTGQKLGHEMKRDQMKAALEKTAPVEQMNWAMHLDQSLRTAIESALKKDPGFLQKMSPYVVGMGAESLVRMLHEPQIYGHVVLAGMLLKEAMRHPPLMSRLGIALDHAGVAIPKGMSAMSKFGPPLTLGPTIQHEGMPDWESSPPPGSAPEHQPGPPSPELLGNPWAQ